MQSTTQTLIDVGAAIVADRVPLTVDAIEQLAAGDELILVSHEDLSSIHESLPAQLRGLITWRVLERGPDAWRVRVQKGAQACGCRCSCT